MPRHAALFDEKSEAQHGDEAVLALMKRLGIDVFPAHEPRVLPLASIVVPGAEQVKPSSRLVKSIKRVGILQPPAVVQLTGTGPDDATATYEVIFGRRRVLAAHLAGRSSVTCEVYESATAPLSSLLALIENEQRSAAWIKEVADLRRLIDDKVGMTLSDLVAFGFERNGLTERLKIAQLPEPLLACILAGTVPQTTARKLTRLTASQLHTVERVVCGGERLTEDVVKSTLRRQINAGLVPLQQALEVSLEQHPRQCDDAISSKTGAVLTPPLSPPATIPTALTSLHTVLHACERELGSAPATQRLRLLITALRQETEVVLRTVSAQPFAGKEGADA